MELGVDFAFFVLIGLVASLIGGILGTASSATSSSLLLSLGALPAAVGASVNATGLIKAATDWAAIATPQRAKFATIWHLSIPGIMGAVLGALFLSASSSQWVLPLVNFYLLVIGVYLLYSAITPARLSVKAKARLPLGFTTGFLDSSGGGGWAAFISECLRANRSISSISASELVTTNEHSKEDIDALVSASVFFVSVASTLIFVLILGTDYWRLALGLLLGALIASPVVNVVAKWAPKKLTLIVVGVVIIGLSLWRFIYL